MQSIYFARIKFLSEEFTKDHDYEFVLNELKRIIEREEDVDTAIEQKIIVDLSDELSQLAISAKPYEAFLSSDSKIQLHPESRYYFVTQKLWKRLKEDIFSKAKTIPDKNELNIQNENDFFELARDCMMLEGYFLKKLLVFEAS